MCSIKSDKSDKCDESLLIRTVFGDNIVFKSTFEFWLRRLNDSDFDVYHHKVMLGI